MTNQPTITQLKPIVHSDKRRISMDMHVDNLPSAAGGITLTMPGDDPKPPASEVPYPDITLSILDDTGQVVATLFIVEHKEAHTSLTLHLRAEPDFNITYTARAEMTYQQDTLQTVEVPFTLNDK